LGSLSTDFGGGEWRLNPQAIEFHYFYRRKERPNILHWKDVERLRMIVTGWVFRGKDSRAFIPFQHISHSRQQEVNAFLREILSPDFDLTIKPITGRKFFQVGCAPLIGMLALMACGLGFITLYLNNPVFHPIIPPIVVVCLLGLWSVILISLFITHVIILHKQANKDNPWRYRREHESPLIHEFELTKN
jgi:hypothetical protein